MRIGLSQRVDTFTGYREVRDSLDQQWISFLEEAGFQVVLIPNQLKDPENYYRDLQIKGLILSGGNDPAVLKNAKNVSDARDRVEATLIHYARSLGQPILGVCRGMQYLCLELGEELKRIEGHVSKRHRLICEPDFFYPNGHQVNSYHNWALTRLKKNSPLRAMAKTADQSIEAVQHRNESIYGIMWHPERESKFSRYDLNFFQKVFKND
ncbi:gamma-glutamyl-gamma-aminobutyrate hydrolase family protein [Akkermansiaceae bacterium]|nr:gamma-glutamyl-gamma-aminobutyrate hydrolase family protein [Akkermansiaceae bacterium]